VNVRSARGGRSLGVAAAALALAAGCQHPPESPRGHAASTDSGSPARPGAARDAAASASADVYVPAVPAGPTGTVEAAVFLDGPLRPGPEIQVASTWASRPGCRDAARRYSQPFDVTSPGPFPGALVFVEAHESSQAPVRDVLITFRDCDIVPRVVFATNRDRIILHSDSRQSHLPTITGSGAAIDMLLGPTQRDIERHLPHAGRYPITTRDLPEYTQTLLFVLANRFMAAAGADGVGRVTDVPVGRHLVHAWYPGTLEAREVVEVREGQTAHVVFHLHQAPPPAAQAHVDAGSSEVPP
jgi:hypothetical protein